MGHEHHHQVSGTRLFLTIALNVAITVAQVVGGLLAGSLALLADALHNFSDVVALVVSYIALRFARRPTSAAQTFGYKRAEILAALFNGAVLVAIAVNLCIEALGRLGDTAPVNSVLVMALAGFSVVANGVSVLILQRDAGSSLNMRSAYLHLFSDMLTSIAVLLAGAAIWLWQVSWVDNVLSIGISLYLIWMSYGLLRETLRVVMQFAPEQADLAAMETDLLALPGVIELHHVHLWQLTEHESHFEGHLLFDQDLPLSVAGAVVEQARALLADRHHIGHVTLQAEFGSDHGHGHDTVLRAC